jgi:hypothetical protein
MASLEPGVSSQLSAVFESHDAVGRNLLRPTAQILALYFRATAPILKWVDPMRRKVIVAFVMGGLIAGWAVASDKTDVMAVVKQWDDGFNTGEIKSAVAACADQTSIIDDIPPHEWHGTGGCTKWMNDAEDIFKKNEMTKVVSTLGKSRHVDVTADRA